MCPSISPDDLEILSPAHEADRKALKLLAKEHAASLEEAKKHLSEIKTLQAKCLKLEDALSTDRSSLLVDIVQGVGSSVASSLQRLGLDLTENIAKEFRLENQRSTDVLMSEISVLNSIKNQTDETFSEILVLKDVVEEISGAANLSNQEITRLLVNLKSSSTTSPAGSLEEFELLSKKISTLSRDSDSARRSADTKLSLLVALLTESIKVISLCFLPFFLFSLS